MLRLYYSPGACSMASRIGLAESGARYEEQAVLIPEREHKSEAYLRINPKGSVPALAVDDRVIVENTAILSYIAQRFADAHLMPPDRVDAARCIAFMTWLSNTVHRAYRHFMRPERFAHGEAAQAAVKAAARAAFWSYCAEIDASVGGRWIMGDQYTVADPYALVFYAWGVRTGFPMHELAALTAWKERMLDRAAVRRVLEDERNILIATKGG